MSARKAPVVLCLVICVFIQIAFGYHNAKTSANSILRRLPLATRASQQVVEKVSLQCDEESWRKGFTSCEKETCARLPGSLPVDLEGTYYRNGFGKFEVGKSKVLHMFDADGMICGITIKDGEALFRNSIVRTKGFLVERKRRQISFRGCFGFQKKAGFLGNALDTNLKNVANTNVIYWAGRLLALWEGGLPHKVEADCLRTEGTYTFRGLLKPGGTFTAHPRVDANTGHLVGFSATQGDASVKFVEFDDKLSPVAQREIKIPGGFVFAHDFVVTKNYYILTNPPVSFDALGFLIAGKPPAACITYEPTRPAMVYIVPRDPSKPVSAVPVDPHFNFHFANAFEDDEGNIVTDVIWSNKLELGTTEKPSDDVPIWESFDLGTAPRTTLNRYTFKKSASGTPFTKGDGLNEGPAWSFQRKEVSKTQVDFISVNPKVSCKKHRFAYGSFGVNYDSFAPPQGLIKFDMETGTETKWVGGKDEFLQETIFAPKKSASPLDAEDDGYLLTYLVNGNQKKSEFLIFDAKDITKGPIYRTDTPTFIPNGLHGYYANGLTHDFDDITRRFKAWTALDRQRGWNEVNSGFSGLGISYDF